MNLPVYCTCGHSRDSHKWVSERPNAGFYECSECLCMKYTPNYAAQSIVAKELSWPDLAADVALLNREFSFHAHASGAVVTMTGRDWLSLLAKCEDADLTIPEQFAESRSPDKANPQPAAASLDRETMEGD